MEYILDCSGIGDAKAFHARLKEVLRLPEWYGGNLDAMHDCLTELSTPVKLTLDNFSDLRSALGDQAGKILYVLYVCTEENPNLEISLEN